MTSPFGPLVRLEERLRALAAECGLRVLDIAWRAHGDGVVQVALEELPATGDPGTEIAFQALVAGYDEVPPPPVPPADEVSELRRRLQRGGDIL